jgi:hypothetical protein
MKALIMIILILVFLGLVWGFIKLMQDARKEGTSDRLDREAREAAQRAVEEHRLAEERQEAARQARIAQEHTIEAQKAKAAAEPMKVFMANKTPLLPALETDATALQSYVHIALNTFFDPEWIKMKTIWDNADGEFDPEIVENARVRMTAILESIFDRFKQERQEEIAKRKAVAEAVVETQNKELDVADKVYDKWVPLDQSDSDQGSEL